MVIIEGKCNDNGLWDIPLGPRNNNNTTKLKPKNKTNG